MKFFLTSLLIMLVSFAFGQGDITPKVVDAFKKGDGTSLGSHFMPSVDLNIKGKEESLSREVATASLVKFFSQNPVKSFEIKHQGTSKLDDQFRIGELQTANGEFRVTFFMKKTGVAMQIKQLTIEADEDF
ncbi:MAG: DUF4783 domain-containing protein [Flavobacteriales bacterium]|nr:DUF4783 domain-containing protein [Flavobacteriales bacterium]